MKTIVNVQDLATLEQVAAFMAGTQDVAFAVITGKDSRYRWVERTLRRFRYRSLNRAGRGLLLAFVARISGYSRPQTARLARQFRETGKVRRRQRTSKGFARKYTPADIRLLAEMDGLHGAPNGQAMKRLCWRAFHVFGDRRFARLADISPAHIYNLRRSRTYRTRRPAAGKPRPAAVAIGERRRPQPDGQPGFIRIDTVHQGDLDRRKGLYHINAVDAVTQWELVATVETISERHLVPALALLLDGFPFPIRGFHSDNGSEFVNRQVAALLEKLRIEFTKSRPRRSNDNGLAECKNAHVVRKAFGHMHIAGPHAARINAFNQDHLNPYLNFHRPCHFPETVRDAKGGERRTYPYAAMATPYEKLRSLPAAESRLKPGLNFGMLDAIAHAQSDNQAAERMQQARRRLFQSITEQEGKRA